MSGTADDFYQSFLQAEGVPVEDRDEPRHTWDYADDGRIRLLYGMRVSVVRELAVAALAEVADDVFVHGGNVVVASPTGSLHAFRTEGLIDKLDQHIEFYTLQEKGKNVDGTPKVVEKTIRAPAHVAKTINDQPLWNLSPPLRLLEGVVTAPTLRPDGSVVQGEGYDDRTGLLLCPSRRFPAVPEDPHADEVDVALTMLLDLVGDFHFVDDHARAAWLAALLTAVARNAIDGAVPMFLFEAPVAGSGKTLLCEVVSAIAEGKVRLDAPPPAGDEAECEKRITTWAREGRRTIVLDNVSGAFGWAALDLVVTSPGEYSNRILGQSSTWSGRLWQTFLISANNARLAKDARRRTVRCRIDTGLARPELDRRFRHPKLMEHVLQHRGELLVAALTLLVAHARAGRPNVTDSSPLGSFEAWSGVVRDCVTWLGIGDPAATQVSAENIDDDEEAIATVIEGWPGGYGGYAEMRSRDLLDRVTRDYQDNQELREGLAFLCECKASELTSRIVGNGLKKVRDRVVDGKKITYARHEDGRVKLHHKSMVWTVEEL